jgi:O-antigen/teichoic acid export membrane protein
VSTGTATAQLRQQQPAGRLARLPTDGVRHILGISASLVGTQALTSVLGLVFWALAARTFATSALGVAGAMTALTTLLASLGSLGLGTLLIARLPHTAAEDRRLLVRTCLTVAGAGGGLLAALVPLVGIGLLHIDSLRPIAGSAWAYGGLVAGTAVLAVVMVLDQAVLTVGIGSLQTERNVAASLCKIIVLVALPAVGLTDGPSIVLATTVGSVASLPLVALRSRRGHARPGGRRRALIDIAMVRGLARAAVSHHALNTTLQSTLQILPVLVTVLVSVRDNAYFTTALMVCGFVFALPYAIAIGVFASARGQAREVVARLPLTIGLSAAVSLTAYAVMFPLAAPVLTVFGGEYAAGGADLLRVLALAGVPFVIKDHFVALRRVQGRTTSAVGVLAAFLAVELAAAAVGAIQGGTFGLCAAWVGVLGVEAVVLAVPLTLAFRAHRVVVRLDTPTTRIPVVGPRVLAIPAARAALDAQATTRLRALLEPRPPIAAPAPVKPTRSLLGQLFLVMSLGVALMGVAVVTARIDDAGAGWQQALWVAGQVVIVLPTALRVVLRSTADRERVALAIVAGVVLQVSRVVLDPVRFLFHDEQLHATTWRQLDESGHLFSFNPLLPVSAFYPGLEIVTDAVVRVTALPMFVAANLVLVGARVVMMLALICLVRVLAGSYHAAAIAATVYLANPQLLFFNSQYSYQTLALPLAVVTIYTFVSRHRRRRGAAAVPALCLTATILTHHLTAMLVVAALVVWLLVEAVVGGRRARTDAERRAWHRRELRDLSVMAMVGVGVNAAVMAIPGSPVVGYLLDIFASSGQSMAGLAETGQTKPVFADRAGGGPAPWEQVLLLGSVLITCLALVAAFVELRASVRSKHAVGLVVASVALLYPLVPGGHLTVATSEVGDRAAGFVFVGLAIAVGAWAMRRGLSRVGAWTFAVLYTITFLGSVILGAGPTARQLPGTYLVSADARSMDADNLAAARWEAANLPQGTPAFADRVAGLLASSVGDLRTVRHLSTGIDASPLLLDPHFGPRDVALIRAARIQYLIVDSRISQSMPHLDVYIESGEYLGSTRTSPVPAAALTKFAAVPGVTRLYDNGSLQIYDLRTLLDG